MNTSRVPLLLLALIILASYGCRKEKASPNIVFILADDLGWKDLGCYGSNFYETPNIDRLALSGARFTNAYAACPVCSPTRAAIMTGKYPSRLDITDWIPGDDPHDRRLLGPADSNELRLDEQTLAEIMRAAGYRTFFAGKWHLGDEGYFPEEQGFDINIGGHHRGSPPGGYYVPYKNPKLNDGPEGEYLTDRLTDESIAFLKNNKDHPFLLFLSFYTVHTPIQANKEYLDHYKEKLEASADSSAMRVAEHNAFTTIRQANAAYASMVHALDQNVGRLLRSIEEEGIAGNTLIVFTSDNGGLSTISSAGWVAPTAIRPLRAGKGWCYEGGIRVPLIICSPDVFPSSPSEPVVSMDLLPTILDMSGITYSSAEDIDGISLAGLLHGRQASEPRDIMWHYPHYHSSGWTPGAAIRSGKWKMICFYESGDTELYDLEEDPGENHNLAAIYPDTCDELMLKLKKLQKQTHAVLPESNPAFIKTD